MTRAAPLNPDPRSELSSLIRAGLGHSVDKQKFEKLVAMREHLQEKIDLLSELLTDHKIDPATYLEDLDKALNEASAVGIDALGHNNFRKVFGELRVDKLGDAKAFLELYSKGH
jgi:hypothetical protein